MNPASQSSETSQPVICLDPGHPSEVGRGTRGKRITEIAVAWTVALHTKKRLEDAGIKVVLTKQRPLQLVRNRARAEIANKAGAALMVRLHCDAMGGSGFAVYAPYRQGTSSGVRGPSPQVIAASVRIAKLFHARFARELAGVLPDRGLKPDTATAVGGKQGALTGSVFSRVPVLLIEMGVLTNPRDEAVLASAKGQAKLADAITASVIAAIPAVSAEAPR